jgi:O-antigen/teichoic acid export membrane protein
LKKQIQNSTLKYLYLYTRMKREFIINIILLVLINLLIKPAYIFGVEVRIQNLTGTEAYGMYFHYLNLVYLFSFVNDPGIQNWNAQFVPKNREIAGSHFISLLKVKGFMFGILLMLMAGIGLLLHYNIFYLLMLTANLALSSLLIIIRGTIAGIGMYRTDSWLSASDKFLMLIILGYLAWFSPYQHTFTIDMLIVGQGAALILSCLAGMFVIYRNTTLTNLPFNLKTITSVIKSSAPFLLILVFMTAYNKLDGVMLGFLLNDNNYQAGIYAAGIRFYDAANMVAYLFAALLLPMYASNIFNTEILHELQDTGLRFTAVLSWMIVCTFIFFGHDILGILYTDQDPEIYNILIMLMPAFFTVAVAYIFGTLLVAAGKLTRLTKLFGAGLMLNFLLNLLLIPEYKAFGASVATLVTQLVVMAGQIYLVRKEMQVVISGKTWGAVIWFACLTCISMVLISKLEELPWYVNLLLCGFICIILALITGLVRWSSVRKLLSRNTEAGIQL